MIEIELTQGKVALIDECDQEIVGGHSWHAAEVSTGKWYAGAWGDGKTAYMHRLITSAPKGMVVDHINGDGLDNRRANLRVCLHRENISNRKGLQSNNTTGYVGVVQRRYGKYEARIKVDGETIYLGRFETAIEAAKARDKAAVEMHGDFAFLNLPNEKDTEEETI